MPDALNELKKRRLKISLSLSLFLFIYFFCVLSIFVYFGPYMSQPSFVMGLPIGIVLCISVIIMAISTTGYYVHWTKKNYDASSHVAS